MTPPLGEGPEPDSLPPLPVSILPRRQTAKFIRAPGCCQWVLELVVEGRQTVAFTAQNEPTGMAENERRGLTEGHRRVPRNPTLAQVTEL